MTSDLNTSTDESKNIDISESASSTALPEYPLPRRILSWLITPVYLVIFFGILLVFQPLQIIARRFGYRAHIAVFNLMNLCLISNFRTIGTSMEVSFESELPDDRPLIIVSNHQSMYDIPFMIWHLRKHNPKFISKVELGRWIPSISYALRTLGSVLIDRKNPKAAIPAIERFGRYIEQNRYAAVIFPEGTRGRSGQMRRFKAAGFLALVRSTPSALIVPAVLDGSWEMLRYNLWPVPWGVNLKLRVFSPIDQASMPPERILSTIENLIRSSLGQPLEEETANG